MTRPTPSEDKHLRFDGRLRPPDALSGMVPVSGNDDEALIEDEEDERTTE